jgi:pimeloyl-ACP methyl ester carboxylesterase
MELRVSDVVAVLDQLEIDRAHFFGYSMGGRIGFATIRYAPDRFYSLINGGAQPYSHGRGAIPHPWIPSLEQGIGVAIDKYVQGRGSRVTPQRQKRLLTNDPQALIAMLSVLDPLNLEPDLPKTRTPCLIYAGSDTSEHEEAKRAARSMPKATFISLAGLDHYDGFRRSDLVLPLVKDFLATFSGSHLTTR